MDLWRIDVHGPSREWIVSNGERTHFAADTHDRQQRSYHGLFTSLHQSLSELRIFVDGVALDPREAGTVSAWPWLLQRNYDGAAEEILLPRGIDDLLLFRYRFDSAREVQLRPWVAWRGACGCLT